MSSIMTITTTNHSIPPSPPVTPKTWFVRGRSISPELQLPPIFTAPSSPPTSTINSKQSHTLNLFTIIPPATSELKKIGGGGRSKSTPRRSLSASARGTFTLDLGQVIGVPIINQNQKRKNSSSSNSSVDINGVVSPSTILEQRHYKKQKTDAAAAYDRIDIMVPDSDAFTDPAWIPDMSVFGEEPSVRVVWKGNPLKIDHMPYYELLYPGEVIIASTLRLTPEQYLKCKRALVLAAFEFHKNNLSFRKSDAQKCVRIDVNKTSTLWGVFYRLGWLKPHRL